MQLVPVSDGVDEVYFNPEEIITIKFYAEKTVVTTTAGRVMLQIDKEDFISQWNLKRIIYL
jgi:hypothetical protein